MMVVYALFGVMALVALAPIAVALGASSSGRAAASNAVYGACLVVTLSLCTVALLCLFGGLKVAAVTLPLGLPWLGAHFRIDALAAFFLVVVNLGGAVASLFALGYGRHEHAPQRVLPFYPAYLAAMTLVVMAADAFIIFVALGLALAFKTEGLAWAAALAMTAGLFHVFNHSLFKSMLFFGAGSVHNATGTRDMEQLLSLIHI